MRELRIKDVPTARFPLGLGQFVVRLEFVLVRIAEVDPERQPVVADAYDLDVVVFQPLMESLEVVPGFHLPGHVDEPLALLLGVGLIVIERYDQKFVG